MKIKVIVDKKPYNCLNCDLARQYVDTNWACSVTRRHIVTANPIPDWCPLEVETDGWKEVEDGLPKNPGWVIAEDNRGEVYPCIYEDSQWLNDIQEELPSGCFIVRWKELPKAQVEAKDE